MSSSPCLRCLTRPIAVAQLVGASPSTAAFSTSAARAIVNKQRASVLAKRNPNIAAAAGAWSGTRGRKGPQANTGKIPEAGERKAGKKRVVLSNANALDPGLDELDAGMLALVEGEAVLKSSSGRVLALPQETVDALSALQTFSPTQSWHLFHRPATLIRQETVELAKRMFSQDPGVARELIFGERGSGKSVHLLQAQAMALLKGWLVMHIPDGNEVTIGHTAYQPIRTHSGTQYIQPKLTARLLGNFVRANRPILETLSLSMEHKLPVPVQSNMSLDRFASLGAGDSELAWPIWNALWAELTSEAAPRPPVLYTCDNVDHVMRHSAYLASDSKPVHAFDLALVAHFMRMLSGSASLPNGGAVLAAVGRSNRASAPTLDHFLAVHHAAHDSRKTASEPNWNVFVAQDEKVRGTLSRVPLDELKGLTKEEARSIMEYYAASGLVRGGITTNLVSEKWAVAGGGIIGQLQRASLDIAA